MFVVTNRIPVAKGHVSGSWYYEENSSAARLGIRVSARLHEERSRYQKLTVYETPFFGRVLTLDDVVMLTERDEFVYHEMLVHVPLVTIPEPKRVLVIDDILDTGASLAAGVELLAGEGIEVIGAFYLLNAGSDEALSQFRFPIRETLRHRLF